MIDRGIGELCESRITIDNPIDKLPDIKWCAIVNKIESCARYLPLIRNRFNVEPRYYPCYDIYRDIYLTDYSRDCL